MDGEEEGRRGVGFLAVSPGAGSCQSLQWERNSAAIKPGFITTRPEMEGEDGDRDRGDGEGGCRWGRGRRR